MTMTVTVKTNTHRVEVTELFLNVPHEYAAEKKGSTSVVPAHTERDFYVHDGKDLRIHEVKD